MPMRLPALGPCSTAGILFPSVSPGTILVTLYSIVWNLRVLRAELMHFYWPKLLAQILSSTAFPFSFFFYGLVLCGWVLRTDIVSSALSHAPLTVFNNNNPSNLTSVYLLLALHLLPSSTPFWPYGTQPFSPRVHILLILSDPVFSPTLFLFSFFTHLFIPNSIPPNFSNTSSQEHSLSFCQQFSYPMPLTPTTPLLQILLLKDTSYL